MKKLPIPELEFSKQNFIKHASAFDGFNSELCERFFNTDAPRLQECLVAFDEIVQSSYLERLWNKSYLASKEPLAIASNFCFKLPYKYDLEGFICAFANLISSYENGALELKNARGEKIFARQFEILKGGCRVPKKDIDEFRLNYKNSSFYTIMHENNLYKFDLEQNCSARLVFSQAKAQFSLAQISFLPQEQAARLYQKYEDFNAFFEVVENARFNICIVNEQFKSHSDEVHFMQYHAPCYHYKTLNFIYNQASQNIYINSEHSFLDGGSIAFILEQILQNYKALCEHKNEIKEHKNAQFIQQYFDDELENALKNANYAPLSQNDLFEHELAQDFGFSKDFIMQAAIAYASKHAYSKYVCQYEAVDMREYDFGRTECVRAISSELIKALESFSLKDFELANAEHKQRIKNCKSARGIDRHLLGLKTQIAAVPNCQAAKEFFASKMYQNTCETIVSTSSLGKNDFVDVFYFHPVISDGIGVSYAFSGGKCFFALTYFSSQIKDKFSAHLAQFFDKFNQLN